MTSHEVLDPKKRPNDANELLLFSDTSMNNETHSNEILHTVNIANHGSLCKRIIMIKKTSSNQPCGRDSECKMVRF